MIVRSPGDKPWTGDKTDGASGRQDQNYGKGKNMADGSNKELATKSLPMIKGGGSGTTKSPTGSSQSYPKGSKVNMSADWNPQKGKGSTYGIGGV